MNAIRVAQFGGRRRLGAGPLGRLDLHGGHPLPALPTDVFEPHGGALVLGAPRVSHRFDIDPEGLRQAALHIVRRQIDEEYRQLAVSSSSGGFRCEFGPVALSPLSDPRGSARPAAAGGSLQ